MTAPLRSASEAILRLPVAEVFVPLLGSYRYKGAKGGRASAKSHFFGELALDYCVSYPSIRVCCIREVQKSLKRSSKLLLEDKIKHYKLSDHFSVVRDEIRTPGDGVIIFQGMQDHTADSIKSLEGFDVFWVEEAQNLSQRSLDLLRPTARSTQRSVLAQPELWFSWNSKFPTDPVESFFSAKPPDSALVHATFRDNPWFPRELKAEIEWDRRRDPEKYHHVWEGGFLARSEARVFNNWRVDEFEPPRGVVFHFGADWGFSVDPTVLVCCFIVGRTLYVWCEAYKVGCEIDDIPALFDSIDPERKGFARQWSITADSQRPDTISYVRRHGYPGITNARKGPGSIEDGIEFLKNYDIVVHPQCIHVIDELTLYSYKVDKLTDKVLPILEDKKNHTIDALRYAVEDVRWAVAGDVSSTASDVSACNDGAIAVDFKSPVGDYESFAGHEYDGGLT